MSRRSNQAEIYFKNCILIKYNQRSSLVHWSLGNIWYQKFDFIVKNIPNRKVSRTAKKKVNFVFNWIELDSIGSTKRAHNKEQYTVYFQHLGITWLKPEAGHKNQVEGVDVTSGPSLATPRSFLIR